MRYLFQRPLPDELLTSALVRTCVRFDLRIKPLMRAICDSANAPSFFHMTNIGEYAKVLHMDPITLLYKSTLFPTLVAFQSWERRVSFESAALARGRTHSIGLFALQSTSSYVPYRRLCSLCVRSDKSRYGWSYWHVAHHLPGVSRCNVHGVRLRETALTTSSGVHRWSYQLPDEVESEQRRTRRTKFEDELNRLALATQAENLWSALSPMSDRFYRIRLELAGLVSPNCKVNAMAARQWIAGHVAGVSSVHHLLREDTELTWVDLILRNRPCAPFPAFKHLVIQAAIASTPQPALPTLNHKPSGNRARDLIEIDLAKAKELDTQIRLLLETKERFTLQGVLTAIGTWDSFRHARERYPAVRRVIELHRPAMTRMKNQRPKPGNQ